MSGSPTNNGTEAAAAAAAAAAPEGTTGGGGAKTGYEDPELLHKLADVLRTKMKIRNGVLQETRVDYFKGVVWEDDVMWGYVRCPEVVMGGLAAEQTA